jgi:hypothetical protein
MMQASFFWHRISGALYQKALLLSHQDRHCEEPRLGGRSRLRSAGNDSVAAFASQRSGLLVLAFIFIIFFIPDGLASPPIKCPAEISVIQKLSGSVPGFAVSDKGIPHRLENIEFSSGPPNQQAWLAPSSSNTTHSTWDFLPNDNIFISCDYGYTSLILSQPLPPHTKSCKVQFDASFSPPLATGVACQ